MLAAPSGKTVLHIYHCCHGLLGKRGDGKRHDGDERSDEADEARDCLAAGRKNGCEAERAEGTARCIALVLKIRERALTVGKPRPAQLADDTSCNEPQGRPEESGEHGDQRAEVDACRPVRHKLCVEVKKDARDGAEEATCKEEGIKLYGPGMSTQMFT
jgi:hypothetical protein